MSIASSLFHMQCKHKESEHCASQMGCEALNKHAPCNGLMNLAIKDCDDEIKLLNDECSTCVDHDDNYFKQYNNNNIDENNDNDEQQLQQQESLMKTTIKTTMNNDQKTSKQQRSSKRVQSQNLLSEQQGERTTRRNPIERCVIGASLGCKENSTVIVNALNNNDDNKLWEKLLMFKNGNDYFSPLC